MANLPFIVAEQAPAPERVTGNVFGGDKGFLTLGRGVQELGATIGEIDNHLYAAEQRAIARREIVNAAGELRSLEDELHDAPDYNASEKVYKEKVNELRKRQTGLTGPFADEFAADFETTALRGEVAVRARVRERRLDTARAATQETIDELADQAANARSPGERDEKRAQIAETVQDAVNGTVLDATQGYAALKDAEKSIQGADIREAIRNDPTKAFSDLLDPNGPYKELPADELQAWANVAQTEVEQEVNRVFYAEQRARTEQKQAEDDLADAADSELMTIALERGITKDDVMARWDALDVKGKRRYQAVLANGGRPTPTVRDNPVVASNLLTAALAGEAINKHVADAVADGEILPTTQRTLIRVSQDKRFTPARNWLHDMVKARTTFGGAPSAEQVAMQSDSELALEEWILANPEAGAAETIDQARKIARSQVEKLIANDGKIGTEAVDHPFSRAMQRAGIPAGLTPAEAIVQYPDEFEAAMRDPELVKDRDRLERERRLEGAK